jgi:membrane-associated phospholipid phosphatase
LTYNPEVSMPDRTGIGKSNAFFSGHTSWSATSTFLLVKMYTDYHQIKGWKRIALYTGAAVPPGMVGYYRMRAGKHFKTDVITGLLLGAACGIGIPELHRVKKKNTNLSLQPFFFQGASGLTISYNP